MPVVSAPLEAVPTKIPSFETRLGCARFDDRGDGPGRNWLTANAGQGRGFARPRQLRQPDPSEHRAGLDSGRLQPGSQGAHRAQLGVA
jgi:hypothetical protein